MNQIETEAEMLLSMKKLQDAIKKETEKDFRFEFTVNFDGKVSLSVGYGFILELRDKNKKVIKREFIGNNMSASIKDFFNFFVDGGEGKVTADENGFQFRVQFHYENGWIADHGHTGSYCYTD